MANFDPFVLAARQIELDRAATTRVPALYERKKMRLAPSPHTFLRGSAPLFYEMLAARPELASGPAGDGSIVGDMHLENVGAYRTDADEVTFGLNDFDDATIGPLRLDVLRLSTSVLLAGRGFRATGAQSIALVEHLIVAYLRALSGGPAPPEPAVVTELVGRVADRRAKALLDDRAPEDAHGKRRFLRGDRYLDLPPDVEARVPSIVAAYVAALADRASAKAADWKVEDAALRIAGNGSLGVVRLAVLVKEHGGDERLLELKECRPSSTEALLPAASRWAQPAERVVSAARALLAAAPRRLAAVHDGELSLAGRRLFPQEDKLDLESMHAGAALDGLVQLIGHTLGAAHARGVASLGGPPPAMWTRDDVAAVIDHAVVLAGMLEAIALAWVRRSR